jgi:hypothetical protein
LRNRKNHNNLLPLQAAGKGLLGSCNHPLLSRKESCKALQNPAWNNPYKWPTVE